MIPFIRSISELMAITKSTDQGIEMSYHKDIHDIESNSIESKTYIESTKDKKLGLPDLPRTTRRKWIRSKKAVSKFLDELDYNNQIQSSYDLTLLARQSKIKDQDAA